MCQRPDESGPDLCEGVLRRLCYEGGIEGSIGGSQSDTESLTQWLSYCALVLPCVFMTINRIVGRQFPCEIRLSLKP